MAERKAMIDREHDLPVTRQAEILKISRGSVYYLPRPVSSADLKIMQRLDRLHLEYPFAGSRSATPHITSLLPCIASVFPTIAPAFTPVLVQKLCPHGKYQPVQLPRLN